METAPETTERLLGLARAWVAEDPDPVTRNELETVIKHVETGGDPTDLADRFAGPLEFGTAGLRGILGAGPNRMNRVVVTRAAAGLVAYLKDTGTDPAAGVVIGFDARHNSERFALDTAEVVTGAGFRAYLLPGPLPTPVLAFAIRDLGCAAGVMVTASHNPAQDNGYKVYLGDGSQIIPPVDTDISTCIGAVGSLDSIPRGDHGTHVSRDLVTRYVKTVTRLVEPGPRNLTMVYTPLHGVGAHTATLTLREAGFAAPLIVPEQEHPDPDFPTVPFPNPEEKGALDLAFALAAQANADVVVANDPDADRCAVGVPGPNGWRMLTGDEVGALLAHHLLTKGKTGTYATTIVSSTLLNRMATNAGQEFTETLTGFKWIGRVPNLAFGYEEALGYCVDPEHVADKDGISALLLIAELAAALKENNRTLADLLDEIAVEFGVTATSQLSVRVSDLAEIPALLNRLAATPPASLAGLKVQGVDDLALGSAGVPGTPGLRFRLEAGTRVIVRPSGTEPKIKCYFETVTPVADPGHSEDVMRARAKATRVLTELEQDLKNAAGL